MRQVLSLVIGTLSAKPRYTNHPVVKGATFSAGAVKSIASTCTAVLDCGESFTTAFTGMLKFQSPEEESTSSVLFHGLVSRRVRGTSVTSRNRPMEGWYRTVHRSEEHTSE